MVKVRVGLNGSVIECQDYKWKDNGIVLYNATYNRSLWKRVEIFNSRATIFAFIDETVLETPEETELEIPEERPEDAPW